MHQSLHFSCSLSVETFNRAVNLVAHTHLDSFNFSNTYMTFLCKTDVSSWKRVAYRILTVVSSLLSLPYWILENWLFLIHLDSYSFIVDTFCFLKSKCDD